MPMLNNKIKVENHRGYSFLIPKDFNQSSEKLTEYWVSSNHITYPDAVLVIRVNERKPIDIMDKQTDKTKELSWISEAEIDEFIKQSPEQETNPGMFLISSGPYKRKNCLADDKTYSEGHQTHYRLQGYDLICSVMRRSFIKPMLDTFQDVVICSKFVHPKMDHLPISEADKEAKIKSTINLFLSQVHQQIVDSVHPTEMHSH